MHSLIQPGQIIDVVAPGYPCTAEEIEGAVQFLKSWGLVPRLPKNLIGKHFLHSNTDELRFKHLKQAIEAPDSDIIWCLRGGYGSNRLLPRLAEMKKPTKAKLLIGISDITSLHTFFHQEWGWRTLHGPLLDRLGKSLVPAKIEKELQQMLAGETKEIVFSKLKPLNKPAREIRALKGKVVGGNLSVLQSGIGTPWQIDTKNAFLFIEDWGERGYRIDKMLEQMRQAGVFKKCRALLLGDFLGGEEPKTGKNNFSLVFRRWAEELDIPVLAGVEAGHGVIQRPLPLGTKAELKVQAAGKSSFSLMVKADFELAKKSKKTRSKGKLK